MKISTEKIFHNTIQTLCITIFYSYITKYLFSFQIGPLATLCLPLLAVFFGFTALLYNRARAITDGPEQRRTLYAAERAMQATMLYFYALLTGSIITAILLWINITPPNLNPGEIHYPFSLYFIPAVLGMFSFGTFIFSLRAISHRKLRPIRMREIMKQIRSTP
jgi:uncharacterized integral membrane protein